MCTHTQTDAWMPALVPSYKLPFDSGEPISDSQTPEDGYRYSVGSSFESEDSGELKYLLNSQLKWGAW